MPTEITDFLDQEDDIFYSHEEIEVSFTIDRLVGPESYDFPLIYLGGLVDLPLKIDAKEVEAWEDAHDQLYWGISYCFIVPDSTASTSIMEYETDVCSWEAEGEPFVNIYRA